MAAERNDRGDFYIFDGETSHWVGSVRDEGNYVGEHLEECENQFDFQALLAKLKDQIDPWKGYDWVEPKPGGWPWEYDDSKSTYYTVRWVGDRAEVYVYGSLVDDETGEGDAMEQRHRGEKADWFPKFGGVGKG